MNIRTRIFGLLFLITASVTVFFPLGIYGQDRVHTVQKGETLYSIARAIGIRADDLMKHNGITDPSRLQAGQRIKIPGSGTTLSTGGFTTYRAVRGDTLYSIARKYSVTVGAIQEANNLTQNYVLKEGDSLRIPQVANAQQVVSVPQVVNAPQVVSVPQGAKAPQETKAPVAAVSPTPSTSAASSVRWPINALEVSYMTGKLQGVAITGKRGESVTSLTRGTVLSAGPYRGFGRVVIVQVDGGYLYVYAGCESLSVKEGDRVGPGVELGKLGVDAVSNKPQLFFMVYRSNTPIDPAKAPRA